MEENKMRNIVFTEVDGKPVMESDSPFPEAFYFSKFYEDREYKKFIKNVERQVRSSREYHMYVELLRTNVSALNLDSSE